VGEVPYPTLSLSSVLARKNSYRMTPATLVLITKSRHLALCRLRSWSLRHPCRWIQVQQSLQPATVPLMARQSGQPRRIRTSLISA